MRLKILLPLGVLALLALLAISTVTPTSTVEAAYILQGVPRLDGMNIYFTEASKEASRFDRFDSGLSRFAGLLRQQGANLYTLEWRTGFPTDADLIVIAGPVDDLLPDQIARLWSYANNNGRLLLLANPVVDPVKALPATSGLFQLMWADMGVRARADVVAMQSNQLSDETEEPNATPRGPRLIADFVTDNLTTDHPITEGLNGELAFFTARSLEVDASIQDFEVMPLVFTNSNFYGESAYQAYLTAGTLQFNIGSDTTQGPLALAAAFENPRTGSRFVVIGDREFATNGRGFQTSPPNSASFLHPANVRFMMNAVTWLVDADAVELSFPTPGPTATVTITPTVTPTPTQTPTATAAP
jgi:hypothetical protein